MSHSIKLLIPVGLGIVAAGINWFAVKRMTEPVYFVQVTTEVAEGTVFTKDNLGAAELPAHYADLKDTAFPYAEDEGVGVLLGKRATRHYRKGDLVFRRDRAEPGPLGSLKADEEVHVVSMGNVDTVPQFMRIGGEISFRFQAAGQPDDAEWVGPFKLRSVGSRIVDNPYGENQPDEIGQVSNVGVILEKEGSEGRTAMDDRLEELCDKQAAGAATLLRIKYHSPQEEGSETP